MLRIMVLAVVLVLGSPAQARPNDGPTTQPAEPEFFGIRGHTADRTAEPEGTTPLGIAQSTPGRTDFSGLEAALDAMPANWLAGTTSGPEWDKIVGERLINKTITYTGRYSHRIAAGGDLTGVGLAGRLPSAYGGLSYLVSGILPKDSPDPVLRSYGQTVTVQGRIIEVKMRGVEPDRVLNVRLDQFKSASAPPSPPAPDIAALAAENAQLKAEVERLAALCQSHGIDARPGAAPPDPAKPVYNSVQEALNAFPKEFFMPGQSDEMRKAWVQVHMRDKPVTVRLKIEPAGNLLGTARDVLAGDVKLQVRVYGVPSGPLARGAERDFVAIIQRVAVLPIAREVVVTAYTVPGQSAQ